MACLAPRRRQLPISAQRSFQPVGEGLRSSPEDDRLSRQTAYNVVVAWLVLNRKDDERLAAAHARSG